jgi:type II secretory pathway pseudopilin PulG
MTKFWGLSPSAWVVIAILALIASGVGGILTLQLQKAQREEVARQEYARLQQQRASEAAAVNKREHDVIEKMPDFKLLRN